MARKIFRAQKQACMSVSTRTEPSYSIVNRFKTYCRDQGTSVQNGLLEVVEAFLDERNY